jgi:flavin-dependent dehydrogenase
LCGDAAGPINPLTGDGIHYAMSSGMFAAQICMLAVEANAYNASFLSKYQQLWKNDFGEEIRLFSWVLKRLLKKIVTRNISDFLSEIPRFLLSC